MKTILFFFEMRNIKLIGLTTAMTFLFSIKLEASTIECASPYMGYGSLQASLTFSLDSKGMPIRMKSRFNTATGEVDVQSSIFKEYDGDALIIEFNKNSDNAVALAIASPEYKLETEGRIFFRKGSIFSFPNATPYTQVNIHGAKVNIGNGLVSGMNCKLFN